MEQPLPKRMSAPPTHPCLLSAEPRRSPLPTPASSGEQRRHPLLDLPPPSTLQASSSASSAYASSSGSAAELWAVTGRRPTTVRTEGMCHRTPSFLFCIFKWGWSAWASDDQSAQANGGGQSFLGQRKSKRKLLNTVDQDLVRRVHCRYTFLGLLSYLQAHQHPFDFFSL
jgi:hypothetical protein